MSFLFPKPKPPEQRYPEAVQLPGAQQGEPLPFLFGTHHMTGVCVYPAMPGAMIYRKVVTGGGGGKGGFGGGYATGQSDYFLNFAIAYAANPVARLIEIKVDDHIVWGSPNPGGGIGYASANNAGYVTLRQGLTLKGLIRFYFGLETQAVDSFFINHSIKMPSWPGWCWAFFEDFEVGTSPTVPKIRIRAEAMHSSPLRDPHRTINTGVYNEANPVHLLADIYTNSRYGLGLDPLTLDDSWEIAAEQVWREGLGVSGYLDRQDRFTAFADDLLDHIGAVFVPRGAQLGIRLIRRTYSLSDAPIIEAEHFAEVTLTPSIQTTAVTELMVEFSDATRDYTTSARPLPNIAAAKSTGVTRRERLALPYFTSASAALAAAQGRAPLIVTPPDQLKFKLNRYAGIALEPGDVFRPVYPLVQNGTLDGSRVFRISKITRPLTGLYLEGEAFEECAMIPTTITTDVANPTLTGIVKFLAPAPQLPIELPWDLSENAAMQVSLLAARAQQIYSAFRLLGGIVTDQFDLLSDGCQFVQAGTLAAPYSKKTLTVDDTGFVLVPALPADAAEYWPTASVLRSQLFDRARLGVIHNPATGDVEFIAWQSIEPEANNYRVSGILRGLFDTQIRSFPAGASVFLFSEIPFTVPRLGGWGNGVTLNLKAMPYDLAQQADPSLMPTKSLLLVERAKRPFPVSNLRVNGEGGRRVYRVSGTIRLDWIPRTRGAGAGYLNPDGPFDPNIAPEGSFKVREFDGTSLIKIHSVPSGQTYTDSLGVTRHYLDFIPAGNRLRVASVLNGWESLNQPEVLLEVE